MAASFSGKILVLGRGDWDCEEAGQPLNRTPTHPRSNHSGMVVSMPTASGFAAVACCSDWLTAFLTEKVDAHSEQFATALNAHRGEV